MKTRLTALALLPQLHKLLNAQLRQPDQRSFLRLGLVLPLSEWRVPHTNAEPCVRCEGEEDADEIEAEDGDGQERGRVYTVRSNAGEDRG